MGRRLRRLLGALWLRLTGWKAVGSRPEIPRFVLIAAPHTTNWDLPFMLAVSWRLGVELSWMGKHTIFRWPFGRLMRALGGIPVDRDAPVGLADQMTAAFALREHLILTIAPSASRSSRPYWKSGFYRISRAAGVPIVCGFLDYERRVGGLGPTIYPTGDVGRDMDAIREFYCDIEGKRPDRQGRIRLRDEDEPPQSVM